MFKKNISIFLLLSALLVTVSVNAEETETETIDAIEVEFEPDVVVRPQIIAIDRIVAVVNEDVITRT